MGRTKKKDMTVPMIFKEHSKDFGKTPADLIAWIKQRLPEERQMELDSICSKGTYNLKYLAKSLAFEWRPLPVVLRWAEERNARFDWTEAKRKEWIAVNPERFAKKTWRDEEHKLASASFIRRTRSPPPDQEDSFKRKGNVAGSRQVRHGGQRRG